MAKNRLIFQSFEDRKTTLVIGFFCLAYFLISYIPESGGWVARILPPWPLDIFLVLASAVLLSQSLAWKVFRHFEAKWYRSGAAWALFFCEYGLLLFTLTFFSWPFYRLYAFIMEKRFGH